MQNHTPTPISRLALSAHEDNYGQFLDRTLEDGETLDATRLMRDMNGIYDLLSGLGVVLRMVGGNCVVAEGHSEDPDCPAPLSPFAIGALTAMAATICEDIRDNIGHRARTYNSLVKA